jgi:hypothetical protein
MLNIWKSGLENAVRIAVVAGAALLVSPGTVALAHPDDSTGRKSLEGAWFVRVTLRACDTNASLGSFLSLVSFHEGGTISETTSSPAFAIGQRSPGHGVWQFEGHRTYSQQIVSLINFDTAPNLPGTPGFNPALPVTPGFFAGWAVVAHTLQLTDADHTVSSGTNAFYKADGTLYRTGCSTAVATRFE